MKMSLFMLDEVHELDLEFKLPELQKNYVTHIIEEIPIGRFKTESLSKIDHRFHDLANLLPQYEISGNKIKFTLHTKKFSISLGGPIIPPEFSNVVDVVEDDIDLFSKDTLHKVSIDVNHMLGIILSLTGIKYEDIKVSGVIRLKKESDINVSFSNIINSDNLEKIGNNVKVTGMVIQNKDEEEWKYYLRNGDGSLTVTIWFDFNLISAVDVYELIEKCVLMLNDLLLNV